MQFGFSPLLGPGLQTSPGKVVRPIATAPEGMTYRGCAAAGITHNAQNDNAMSGGALVDEAGDVLGLLSYGDEVNGWCVPSELIAEKLEEMGLLPEG